MNSYFRFFCFLLGLSVGLRAPTLAQTGRLAGVVKSALNGDVLPGATITIQNLPIGTEANERGEFTIAQLKPAIYTLIVGVLGYRRKVVYDVEVSSGKTNFLTVALDEESNQLETVEVASSPFHKTIESPVSLKTISASEIARMPGGLRDISRVIQAYPGVTTPATPWRNDLIIRGGASYENKFYVDGIQIPNINHFTPQGSSGGAYGMINTAYLKDVDMYSGAFPANRGGALSSFFEFHLRDGNAQKTNFNLTAGTTDLALSVDGALSPSVTYLFSVRRADWTLISKSLGLSIFPRYDDLLVKLKYKDQHRGEFTLLGLGANDHVKPNLDAQNGPFVDKSDDAVRQTFRSFTRQINLNQQYNFTLGGQYRVFTDRGSHLISTSYYQLHNELQNYRDQRNPTAQNQFLDYASTEGQLSLRYEWRHRSRAGLELTAGLSAERYHFAVQQFSIFANPAVGRVDTSHYTSTLSYEQVGAFVQLSRSLLKDRLALSLGLRTDMSPYAAAFTNPLRQLSPRFSASYQLTDKVSLNMNTGIYYQMPPVTLLGYRTSDTNELANQAGLRYMQCAHWIVGADYTTSTNLKISVEGFYKDYHQAPFLLDTQIPLASYSSVVMQLPIGNAPASSSASGRSRGLEVMLHQKLWKGLYSIVSYTLLKSEYRGLPEANYTPASWDARHTLTLTGGKQFKKEWELGVKFRMATGSPYTPINVAFSSLRSVYDVTPSGFPDLARLNSQRFGFFNSLDLRLDKKVSLKHQAIDFFLDVQNVYNQPYQVSPFLGVQLDGANQPVVDPNNPAAYLTKLTDFKAPFSILPLLGMSVDW